MDLRDDVIEGGAPAKGIVAVGAPIPPAQEYLITGRAASDQAGFFNVVLIHRGPRGG
jgi:hypothetical protein